MTDHQDKTPMTGQADRIGPEPSRALLEDALGHIGEICEECGKRSTETVVEFIKRLAAPPQPAPDAEPDYEAAARALGYQQIPSGTWFHPNQHPNFTERFKTAGEIFERYFGKHWPAQPAPDALREALARLIEMDDEAAAASGEKGNLNGVGLVDLFDIVDHPFGKGKHKQQPYRSNQLEVALIDARAALSSAPVPSGERDDYGPDVIGLRRGEE